MEEIAKKEPLITNSRKDQVVQLVQRLQQKIAQPDDRYFYLFKVFYLTII